MMLANSGRLENRGLSLGFVDSSIHNEVPSINTLMPYLSKQWAEQIDNTVFRGPADADAPYPPDSDMAVRPGSRFEGGPANLHSIQEVALTSDIDVGILLCTYAIDSLHNPDQAVALSRAVNDWQIAEWLDADSRLRASIVVPSQIPLLAAEEIERVGQHPGFVQVALPARSQHPYGSRLFHPMWEAISRHDLVGGVYFGGAPGNPPTAVGWPSYFIEEYVGMTAVFAAQVTSLISEGVFDKFPSLRVTLLESGCTWLPSHMWRFDKEWKNLRLQVPWVRQAPSAYVREHIRLTTEPWDLPADERRMRELYDQLGSDELLLCASGYPHLRSGEQDALLSSLSGDVLEQVRGGNARIWYRL